MAEQRRAYARPAKPWGQMSPEEKAEFAADFVANVNAPVSTGMHTPQQVADDLFETLGIVDVIGYDVIGRGSSWTVLSVLREGGRRNLDYPFVVVQDDGSAHIETVPGGSFFDALQQDQ